MTNDDSYQAQAQAQVQSRGPRGKKFQSGLLIAPVQREVVSDDMEHPLMASTYSTSESAQALGISRPTLVRYQTEGIIPGPVLRDAVRGYPQYSVGELRVIMRCLAEHGMTEAVLTRNHTHTVHRLRQNVEGYRRNHV